jgi:DNA-binding response OmpR family regulator
MSNAAFQLYSLTHFNKEASMLKILLIEDNQSIREMICAYFEGEEYEILLAGDARTARKLFAEHDPNVILIDIGLPDTDGITLCQEFRVSSQSPIIMISGEKEVNTKIKSLSYGADDYICKPFSLKELEARIHAHLRGRVMTSREETSAPKEKIPMIGLDQEKRCIYIQGSLVEITHSEFEIVKLLMHHPGRVFTREELITRIRDNDTFVNDRSIDVHITNLRRKIASYATGTECIKTVWGVGYKFVLD